MDNENIIAAEETHDAESADEQLKVLIVAPHASAKFGGESILPLHYFQRLPNSGVEVWMVLHERTKAELTELCPERMDHIHFVPDRGIHKLLFWCSKQVPHRIGFFTFGFLLGLITQYSQRKVVKSLIDTLSIDVVHEPIRVSPKTPSMMCGFGVPVVIGPMNGGMKFPAAFTEFQSKFEKVFTQVGRFSANLFNCLIPGKRYAETLVVANQRTREALPSTRCKNIVELVENGVDFDVFNSEAHEGRQAATIRLVFLGRLVDWKAVDLLLHAIRRSLHLSFELHLLGDGPDRAKLERLSKELGISDRVIFHGFKPQSECAGFLKECHCLVLPSLYECGGAVVLEAMAMGLPVIATDWGGPTDYLDEHCGILVDPEGGREPFVENLVQAIDVMVTDPERRQEMGKNGYRKVREEFDWNIKVEKMVGLYHEAIQNYKKT